MIENLIPEFIIRKYENREIQGEFETIALFLDIANFTALTENLMQREKEGVEKVSELLNDYFSASLKLIYSASGFVTNFLGDGFIALFPESELSKVLYVAEKIRSVFDVKHSKNILELSCKIGIAEGFVKWQIIETDKRNLYYFYGSPIWNCEVCEKKCKPKDILFFTKKPIPENVKYSELVDNIYRLKNTVIRQQASQKIAYSRTNRKLTSFIDPVLQDINVQDEFRDIISCFIRIEHDEKAHASIIEIYETAKRFGGYFKEINREKDNFLILVYFGTPQAIENLFSRALDFALQCKKRVSKIKFGITFGKVFSGFIQTPFRIEFLAIGKTVNLSSRLCSIANWQEILISEDIYRNSKSKYTSKFIAHKKIKGFKQNIPIFQLIRKNSFIGLNSQRELLGRDIELEQLQKLLEKIQQTGKLQIINIFGEAGIGKSFLVDNFKQITTKNSSYDLNWFEFLCDEVIRASFNPIRNFLKFFFEQTEDSSRLENKQKFIRKFENLLRDCSDKELRSELERIRSIIAILLGLGWQNSLYYKLDAKGRFRNTMLAVIDLIRSQATARTCVLHIEDAQWLDKDSLQLFTKLVEELQDLPILITITSRKKISERLAQKIAPKIVINMPISNINRSSARQLMEDIFAGEISPELYKLIWQRSEGNPFFVEQICNYLLENDLLSKKEKIYIPSEKLQSERFQIPVSINSIIISRIDKLTLELKETVKTASVLGREFAVEILSRMLDNSKFPEIMLEGEKKEIWNSLTELVYIFKHSLIRDSVYNMQLKKQLKKLHRLAAETIEEVYSWNISEHYSALAYHYERSEMHNKAIKYLEKAADQAKSKYQNEAAIDYYQRILNIVDDPQKKISILLKQSDIFRFLSQYEQVKNNLADAMNIAQDLNFKKLIAQVKINFGLFEKRRGNLKQALKLFHEALAVFRKIEDKENIANTLLNIAIVQTHTDHYKQAEDNYRRSLEIAKKLDDEKMLSAIAGQYGILLKKSGEYKRSLEYLQLKIELSEKHNDIRSAALAYNNMGNIQMNKGEYEDAKDNFNRALRIMKKIGDRFSEGMITGNLGIIFMSTGHYRKAINFYRRSLQISLEIDDKVGVAVNNGNLAIVLKHLGKYEEALQCVEKRIEINKELEDRSGTAFAYGNLGNILMDLGKVSEAVDSYNKMLHISNELNYKIGKTLALANLGNLYAKLEDIEQANVYLDKAIALERELDLKDHLAQDLNSKVTLLLQENHLKQASELNEEAMNLAKQINAKDLFLETELAAAEISFMQDESNREKILSELNDKLAKSRKLLFKAQIKAKLGFLYSLDNQTDKALENLQQSLSIHKKLDKKKPVFEQKLTIKKLESSINSIRQKRKDL